MGYGMAAQVFHAPFLAILPQYRIHSFVQRSGEECLQKYPDAKLFRSISDMLADDEVELVVITTPNETHFPFAVEALTSGKHVVLEKPFANSSQQARTLVEKAAECGKVLSVYHNRRYVSDFKTIAWLLRQKALGEVHEYECRFDRYRPEPKPNAWREKAEEGSGVTYDLAPHLIDQALCLFGLPKEIFATIKKQRPHAVTDDYFDIRLLYNGLSVRLSAGMLVREMGPRYLIHGHLGSYIKHGDDPQEALLKAGVTPDRADWGREADGLEGLLHSIKNNEVVRERITGLAGNFGEFYSRLYSSLADGEPPSEKPEHGYNTVRLIELAFESDAQKRVLPVGDLMEVGYPLL